MKRLLLSLTVLVCLLAPASLFSVKAYAAIAPGCSKSSFFLGLPSWYEYLDVGPRGADKCAIIGPVDSRDNLDWGLAAGRIGLAIVDILLRIAGLIAVVFVLYGGIRLVLSEGEPDKFKQAKGTIFNAIIGLLIVIIATAVVNLVGGTLAK